MEKSTVVIASTTNEVIKVNKQLYIPNDLSLSILSKLPLKSLKRFGCVQKSWAILLENPNFMSMYRKNFLSDDHSYYDGTSILLHQTTSGGCGSCNVEDNYALYSFSGKRFENIVKLDWPDPFPEGDHGFNIWGSGCSNGILLLVCRSQENIVLWNLATKEFKVIPQSPLDSVPYWEAVSDAHRFGYDPIRDDYKVIRHIRFFPTTNRDSDGMLWEEVVDGNRFGYEFIRADYKVIRRVQFTSRNNCYLDMIPWGYVVEKEFVSYDSLWEIYSLRSNSWKKLDIDMPLSYDDQEVYIDGMCHWWGKSEAHNETCLVSFDLGNEVFCTTPIPSNMDDSSNFIMDSKQLMVLNGSIAMILKHTETDTFHIFILGEIGFKESWTNVFNVGPLLWVDHPIGAANKGDIFFRKSDGGIVWFDLGTQKIEELSFIASGTCIKIISFKENLLPLGGTGN